MTSATTSNLLVTPAELAGERVVVEGEPYRHLFRARRLATDARLRLVDGEGRARWAEVAAIDRRRAELRLLGPAPTHDPARSRLLDALGEDALGIDALVERTGLGAAALASMLLELELDGAVAVERGGLYIRRPPG